MMTHQDLAATERLPANAGIAIGPILFIIAVLGILAAAIAAGSGSFTSSSTNEGNNTKASALLQIGQNLKIGFDRITGNGIDFDTVNIDPTATSADTDLFSPSGGGVSAPSTTMSNTPATDTWKYVKVNLPNMGTSSTDVLAFIRISEGVCEEVNKKAVGLTGTTGGSGTARGDLGSTNPPTQSSLGGAIGAWPSVLAGKPTGCFVNSNGGTDNHYFYQVLGIR